MTDYIVYRDGIKIATVEAPALSYNDDDLGQGEYRYCVTAADETGAETWRTNLVSFLSSGIDAILSGKVKVKVIDHAIVVEARSRLHRHCRRRQRHQLQQGCGSGRLGQD